MTAEQRCRWRGTDQPRAITGRHHEDCADEQCRGCETCTRAHCRVCGVEHAAGACAGCVGAVREDLDEIGRLCRDLVAEVEHRGVDSEAMNLLGPSTDPEAWGHHKASVAVGRIPAEWLEAADSENHPLWVAATWTGAYREAFDHDEPTTRVVLSDELGYLARNLTYIASFEDIPFEDFARDVRGCVAHMERVLHDGEQVDQGVPCLGCGRRLTRLWGEGQRPDGWECKRCHTWSTEDQYRVAVKADYIRHATWLTAEDMTTRTGVKSSTVRSWASEKQDRPVLIRKTLHAERVVYSVEDVLWIDACRPERTAA